MTGPPTKLKWFPTPNDGELTLFIGTAKGFFVLWRQNDIGIFESTVSERVAEGQEILDAAIDDKDSDIVQIVIGTNGRTVQLWNYMVDGSLEIQYSVRFEGTIPRGVAFVSKSNGTSVAVFGLKDGLV